MFSEPAWVVETDADFDRLIARLSRMRVIALDTEADSMYHYQEKLCLLQFTDAEGDIILDPLRVRSIQALGTILADPRIVKVLHGADYDVVSLKRDFGFEIVNMFDTQIAAQFLGLERIGLADLVNTWFGEELDKKFQRHDWSQRPLLPEHLDYARGDTHWLPALREILKLRLVRAGRLEYAAEECEILARREPTRRTFDAEGWRHIKGAGALSDEGQRVLRRLFQWRDAAAREADRPIYRVVGDAQLLEMAQKRPMTSRALEQLYPGMHGLRRRFGTGIVDAVLSGLEDGPVPPPPPEADEDDDRDDPSYLPRRLGGRQAERVLEALKEWRNQLAQRDKRYTAYAIASNGVLKHIAGCRPRNLGELARVREVRQWQVAEHGERILAVLDRVAPLKG